MNYYVALTNDTQEKVDAYLFDTSELTRMSAQDIAYEAYRRIENIYNFISDSDYDGFNDCRDGDKLVVYTDGPQAILVGVARCDMSDLNNVRLVYRTRNPVTGHMEEYE